METTTLKQYLEWYPREGQNIANLLDVSRQRVNQMQNQKKTWMVKFKSSGEVIKIFAPEDVLYER